MELDQRLIDAGIAAAPLIADPKSWINRRVETIELLSSEETRRQVSVDFTLSDEQLKALRIADGVVVPITALTKEPRRAFDLRDESGNAVPVLGRAQNGDLSLTALLHAAMSALDENAAHAELTSIVAALRQIVMGSPRSARQMYEGFLAEAVSGDERRRAIGDDPVCRSMLDTLWANYVLFAVLAPGGRNRRILKYAYSEDLDLTGHALAADAIPSPAVLLDAVRFPDRHPFLIRCDGAWRARSFHVELVLPDELRFSVAALVDADTDAVVGSDDRGGNRASLYAVREVDAEQSVIAAALVGPERRGRVSHTSGTAMVVASLLWLGVASGLDHGEPDAAVSILLGGAALYSGVAAVSGESQLVSAVFRASRRWLVVVTVAALAASACLAMGVPSAHPVGVWVAAALACSLAAVRLGWSAVRADA